MKLTKSILTKAVLASTVFSISSFSTATYALTNLDTGANGSNSGTAPYNTPAIGYNFVDNNITFSILDGVVIGNTGGVSVDNNNGNNAAFCGGSACFFSTLLFEGASIVSESIGQTNPITEIDLNTNDLPGRTIEFQGATVNVNTIFIGATNATTLLFSGVVAFDGTVVTTMNNTHNIEFTADSLLSGRIGAPARRIPVLVAAGTELTLSDRSSIFGTINGSNTGILTFQGSSTIVDAIGATTPFQDVNFNGPDGSVVSLGGNITATNVALRNGGELFINGSQTINGNFDNFNSILFIKNDSVLTVNGNVIFLGAAPIYEIDMGGNFTTTPLLNATGVVDFPATSELAINNPGYSPGTTQTIPIITGGGGSTINNPIIITPNSLLTSYGTTAPGGTVLNLVVTSNPIEDFANQSDTHGVADALDSIAASGVALTGSLQTIFNQLLTYGDVASLNEALSTLVPQVNGAIINEGVNAQNLTFNQIYDHINNQSFWDKHYGKLSSGIDAGDTNNPKSGWVQVFKQHGNQSPRGDMSGYKNDTWGVIVGGDAYYRDDLLLGGALSWSKLDIHDKSTPHLKTKADSYQAALYASLECATPWYYNGIVALAVNDYSSERYIRVGNVNLYPHADYDGWQAGAKLEAGYVYDHDTWQVIPMASAYYTHLSLDAYTETGANTASLNVRDASFDALILGGGFKLVNELVIENQRFFQGEFHTMVFYDLIGDTMALTAQFTGAGPNFRSNGFSPAKASLNLGANASLFSANNWIFSLSYDFDVKQDYTANAGFLRVRHEW